MHSMHIMHLATTPAAIVPMPISKINFKANGTLLVTADYGTAVYMIEPSANYFSIAITRSSAAEFRASQQRWLAIVPEGGNEGEELVYDYPFAFDSRL